MNQVNWWAEGNINTLFYPTKNNYLLKEYWTDTHSKSNCNTCTTENWTSQWIGKLWSTANGEQSKSLSSLSLRELGRYISRRSVELITPRGISYKNQLTEIGRTTVDTTKETEVGSCLRANISRSSMCDSSIEYLLAEVRQNGFCRETLTINNNLVSGGRRLVKLSPEWRFDGKHMCWQEPNPKLSRSL